MCIFQLDLEFRSASHGLCSKSIPKSHAKPDAQTDSKWNTPDHRVTRDSGSSRVKLSSPGRNLGEEEMVAWEHGCDPACSFGNPKSITRHYHCRWVCKSVHRDHLHRASVSQNARFSRPKQVPNVIGFRGHYHSTTQSGLTSELRRSFSRNP